jgi:hypothetical protein
VGQVAPSGQSSPVADTLLILVIFFSVMAGGRPFLGHVD